MFSVDNMSEKKKPSSSGSVAERTAHIIRETKETKIDVSIDLDGEGISDITTPYPFFSHMLTLLARHSMINLTIKISGDLPHHVVEDCAIVLGQALLQALGDKVGIERYGSADIPMDETLATCVLDLSGRPYFVLDLKLVDPNVEAMASEDLVHFFESFALNAKMNLHIKVQYGNNMHHKVEACFKAMAHALKRAIKVTSTKLLSTKGSL